MLYGGGIEMSVASGTGRFSRIELWVRGAKEAIPFYRALFGWELGGDNADYIAVERTGPPEERLVFIQEGNLDRDEPAFWMPVIEVHDVAATVRLAEELGASEASTVLVGSYRLGYITDPMGARFCVMAMNDEVRKEEDQIFASPPDPDIKD